jgi:hypothetical protein
MYDEDLLALQTHPLWYTISCVCCLAMAKTQQHIMCVAKHANSRMPCRVLTHIICCSKTILFRSYLSRMTWYTGLSSLRYASRSEGWALGVAGFQRSGKHVGYSGVINTGPNPSFVMPRQHAHALSLGEYGVLKHHCGFWNTTVLFSITMEAVAPPPPCYW